MTLDPITLDQIRVFLRVADAGSFSAAARELRRAQSAVSYAIANLERLLGVELFERAARTPTLTEAGRALLADARRIDLEVDQMAARARSMAEGTEPRLALVVSVMFPMASLVAVIDAFREAFPTVSLVLHAEALGAVTQLVLDGTCRVGISEQFAPFPPEIQSVSVASVPIVHVAAASHPLARVDGPIATRILDDHVQLVLTDRSKLTEGVDLGVLSGKTWRLADLGAKLEFLRAGFGWGGMPLHLVSDDLASGRLVLIRPAAWTPVEFRLPLAAIHRSKDPPGPAGRWLIDRLAEGHREAMARDPHLQGAPGLGPSLRVARPTSAPVNSRSRRTP